MKAKVFSDDLDNCLIDFDNKLVISDLLNEYGGQLLEISKTLSKSILKEEEKGRQFKKTFIVNGYQENNENYYIIVVDEDKLPSIKETFIDPKIYLYSVEPNGTQTYPWLFQPTKYCSILLRSIRSNTGHNNPDAKHFVPTNASDIKEKIGSSLENANKRDDETSTNEGNARETKGVTIKPKVSPKTKNNKKPASAPKKGIQNFFSASDDKTKSPTKKEATAKKPPNEFFKKQEQKLKVLQKSEEKLKQLPVRNESPPMLVEESSSSDDEEAREALKRDLFADDDDTAPVNPKAKRRRIVESDEEDEPPPVVKKEKEVEEKEMIVDDEKPAEIKTFQDDDGFMITVKDKIKKKSPKKKSPPFVKSERKPINKKDVPKSATKTKQGSITSFFNKK